MKRLTALTIVLGLALAALNATAGIISTPVFSATQGAYDSQISATDLININQSSLLSATSDQTAALGTVTETRDGAGGTGHSTWYNTFDPATLTYTLNTNPATGGSATGYDITAVRFFAGWDSFQPFANQKWDILVNTLASPSVFAPLYSVTYEPFVLGDGASSSLVTLTDSTGKLATGVTALQIVVSKPVQLGGNVGTVIREIDVTGMPTPEPASLALLGLGAMALLRRRRA